MNAMTLFKALSHLNPQDIADAWNGTAPEEAKTEPEQFYAIPAEIPKRNNHPRRLLLRRITEAAACAACLALAVTALLKFRALSGRTPLNSAPNQTAAVTVITTERTGTDTRKTESVTGTADTVSTEPGTEQTTQDTAPLQTKQTAGDTSGSAAETTGSAASGSQTAESSTAETTSVSAEQAEAKIPVMVVLGDGAQTQDNGAGWSILKDKAAIEAYLAGDSPEVTVGIGLKSPELKNKILSNPAMIRVRWMSDDARWSSYGITSAEVKNGVLHLGIAVYCADSAGDFARSPWVYEAALICSADELPDLRDVQITKTEFTESEASGIREWMRFDEQLDPDLYLTVKK